MSNLKRWRSLGGGEFVKWEQGLVIEGVWQGTQPGKFGDNGRVETKDAAKLFSVSAGLKDLKRLKVGTEVRITCQGKRQAKNGNTFWAFGIEVPEDTDLSGDDGGDDDVPF